MKKIYYRLFKSCYFVWDRQKQIISLFPIKVFCWEETKKKLLIKTRIKNYKKSFFFWCTHVPNPKHVLIFLDFPHYSFRTIIFKIIVFHVSLDPVDEDN